MANEHIFRYGLIIFGANYVNSTPDNPQNVVMIESLADAERFLRNAARNYVWRGDTNGAGEINLPDIPYYGDRGDGAYLYRVRRDDPDFAEVLDEPGDRARNAWKYLDYDPCGRFEFGPRGGIHFDWF